MYVYICVCASVNLTLRTISEVIGSFRQQQQETGRLPGNAQEKCWQVHDHSSEKLPNICMWWNAKQLLPLQGWGRGQCFPAWGMPLVFPVGWSGGEPPPKVPLRRGASARNRGYLALSRNSALQLPPLILSSLSKPQLASSALRTRRLWVCGSPPPHHEEWRGRGSSWMIQCISVYSKRGLLRHSHANNHH